MPQIQPEELPRIINVTESKTLPDGSIVFECRCGKTIARVANMDGYRKLDIRLNGRTKLRPARDFVHSWFDSPEMMANKGHPTSKRYGSCKENKGSVLHNEYGFDLGGLCPVCHKRVEIGLTCVLQAVGFEDLKDFQEAYSIAVEDEPEKDRIVFRRYIFSEFHDTHSLIDEVIFGEAVIPISEKQAIKKVVD